MRTSVISVLAFSVLTLGGGSSALATTFTQSAATKTATLTDDTTSTGATVSISVLPGATLSLTDDRLLVLGFGTSVSGCTAQATGVSCPLATGATAYATLIVALTGNVSTYVVNLDLDRIGMRMRGVTTFGPQVLGTSFDGSATHSSDLTVTGPVGSIIGGWGDDVLVGGDGPSTIHGGLGDDALVGGKGNDKLTGGPGDDSLSPGTGTNEIVDGQEGSQDTLSAGDTAGPVTFSLDGVANDTGPGQTVAIAGVENLAGSLGADVLIGNPGFNHIYGLSGNDTIDGAGGGHDVLRGGSDDDVITARDATALFSDVACGQGIDTAILDAADLVASDCETVDRAPAPPGFIAPSFPGGPVQIPAGSGEVAGATVSSRAQLTVSAPKRLRASDLRRGVRLGVASDQTVEVTAELVASATRVTPRAAAAPKDNVVLARATAKGVKARRTLTLRVAPSLRRGVRRVLVRVTAVNAAGQRTVLQRRLRVR